MNEEQRRLMQAIYQQLARERRPHSTHAGPTYWHHDEDFGVFMEATLQRVEDVDGMG